VRPLLAFMAALVAALTAPAQAQVEGAREIVVGTPVTAAAGKSSQADLYYFVGQPGARQGFTLTTKGEAEITLFGPTGELILTAHGRDTVKLEAVIAWLDIHTIAVARAAPAKPYTLTMTASEPTLGEMAFSTAVGSQVGTLRRCWLVPGVKMRLTQGDLEQVNTLNADRSSQTLVVKSSNQSINGEMKVHLDGNDIVFQRWLRDVRLDDDRAPFLPATYRPGPDAVYRGYYCPAAEPAQ
jgi:hypothetical protein